jgi:3-methyl-2-oxobutanoate hydroxymethyltransferase
VLVSYDYLGLIDNFKPKFVKRYAELANEIRSATHTYLGEVKSGAFPAADHTFKSKTMRVVRTRKEDPPARAEDQDSIALYGVPV